LYTALLMAQLFHFGSQVGGAGRARKLGGYLGSAGEFDAFLDASKSQPKDQARHDNRAGEAKPECHPLRDVQLWMEASLEPIKPVALAKTGARNQKEEGSRTRDRRKHREDDADSKRQCEAFDLPGSELVKNAAGDERAD